MKILEIKNPNDAWVIHREEIETLQDGFCDIYIILDASTGYCLGIETSKGLPTSSKILNLIKTSCSKANTTPKSIFILNKDPLAEVVGDICINLKINFNTATTNELSPFTEEFSKSFHQFEMGNKKQSQESEFDEVSREELKSFIPETYGPCPCASGKKFRFCCQKAFKDITFAMCAAQDGNLTEALKYMGQAESKIGSNAEILCRYGICWSFFDRKKSDEYLKKALSENPKHPRTNYILGINSVEKKNYKKALTYYMLAIENYPPEDKFHLSETYNNLGNTHFKLGDFKMAKESWEKALVLLPSDRMVVKNLFDCIYSNPLVPEDIRTISPFIEKFLKRR
jgi:tetratricopeptide (TPR) repeat protein